MIQNYPQFVFVVFFAINTLIIDASRIQCSCPKSNHIFSDIAISGVEFIELDNLYSQAQVIDYFEFIKNETCVHKWKPFFHGNRSVTPLYFRTLSHINPCFENNDIIDIHVSVGKCCQASSIIIGKHVRIDTSTFKKLDIHIDFDQTQNYAMTVKHDISDRKIPICWPAKHVAHPTILENIFQLSLFTPQSDNKELLFGWQLISDEHCMVVHTYPTDTNVFDMTELVRILHNEMNCSQDGQIIINPLIGTQNVYCGNPLPYRIDSISNRDKLSRHNNFTITAKLSDDNTVHTKCQSTTWDSENLVHSQNCAAATQDCASEHENEKPCTCFGAGPISMAGQRVRHIQFTGILPLWNLTFILSNKRDNSKMKLSMEDVDVIDLNETGRILQPMDTFELLAYSPHCTCHLQQLQVIAEHVVYDPSESNQLDVSWDLESPANKSGHLMPLVDVVSRPRSLATDAAGKITRCLSSTTYLKTYNFEEPFDAHYYEGIYDDSIANGLEYWISKDCYVHLPMTYAPEPGRLWAHAKFVTLWSLIAESNPYACTPYDEYGRKNYNIPMLAYITPIRMNIDTKEVLECHHPLPFRYLFKYHAGNVPIVHTDVYQSTTPAGYKVGCHFEVDYVLRGVFTVEFDSCAHMDSTCDNCISGYHFGPNREKCLPDLLASSAYQSLKFSFFGIVADFEEWDLGYELILLNDDGPVTMRQGQVDQQEFDRLFVFYDLQPGNYKLNFNGIDRGRQISTIPDSFYFKSECATQGPTIIVNATYAELKFPTYFEGNTIVYTIYDLSTFETHYPLVDHTDVRITEKEASSLKITSVTAGTKYQLVFYALDSQNELKADPCESFFFETTCNCGPLPGDDAPIVDPQTAITQARGFVTFVFKDNSRCDNGYTFERQEVLEDKTYSDGTVFTPIYFNYKDEGCYSVFKPGKVAGDDLSVSQLKVGTTYRYNIRGVAAGYLGTPSYVYHKVLWESSISGSVSLTSRANNLPVSGVKVSWNLKDLKGAIIRGGTVTTDSSGRFRIEIKEDVAFSNFDAYPVELKFEKTSIIADGSKLNHVFLCDDDRTNCTVSGTAIYLKHLDFDREVRVTDDSAVPITGSVYIANTHLDSTGKVWDPNGCPKANVEVCLVDKFIGANDNRIVCVTSAKDGSYSLPGPIGSRIAVQASFQTHSFAFVPTDIRYENIENTGFVVEAGTGYAGFNFQDNTTATLGITVAGGLCDIYMGEASLSFTIDGCAWDGISAKQKTVAHQGYILPAQSIRVNVNEISNRADIILKSQVIDLGVQLNATQSSNSDQDKKSDFEIRFQYDGTPKIHIDFTENMNSNCTNTDKDQLVVLPFETPMYAIIFMVRDLGDGKLCDNIDPATTIRVDNGLGVLTDSPSEKEYRERLASKYSGDIMHFFEICTSGCTLNITRDFDPVTQRYKSSRVEFLFITGRPSIVEPYLKRFSVTPVEVNAKQYTADVIVIGQYKISDKYSVGLPTHEPLLIIRDPPGGGSSSFYQNIQSTVRVENSKFEAYSGTDFSADVAVGVNPSTGSCQGLFIQLCTRLYKLKASRSGSISTGGGDTKDYRQDAYTGEFTTTWTYTTSTDQFLVGAKSDVFVVPSLNVIYAETAIVEWKASICEATRRDDITFYLKSPDNGPALSFVTVYEIENVEIPSLIQIVNSSTTKRDMCVSEDECNELEDSIEAANDAIIGWKNALQMNEDLKAKAKAGGTGLVRPNEWFNRVAQPQLQGSIGTDDMKVNSAMTSSDLLSKAKLRERYMDADSRTTNLDLINTIKFSGGGSSFTYQLNKNQLSKHTQMLGGRDDNFDGSTKQGIVYHYEATFAIPFLEENINYMWTDKESRSHTMEDKITAETNIGFTLSDPNIGDVFDVDVYIDPRFGTFVFHTRSGRSSCPVEPNTEHRIMPRLEVVSYPPSIVLPSRPMIFELKITNIGDFPGSFVLNYQNQNAGYGGLTFYRILPITFDRLEPGETIYTTFIINRGTVEYEYPALALKIQSACEVGQNMKMLGLGRVNETIVPLYNQISNDNEKKLIYAQTCPAVYLAGAIQQAQTFHATRTVHADAILPVKIRNPHGSSRKLSDAAKLKSTRLEQVQLQYRRRSKSTQTWNIGYYRVNGKLEKINFAAPGLEDGYGFISVDWALDMLGDGDYEFRVVSLCSVLENAPEEFNSFSTEIIQGVIDRRAPKIFGLPTPIGKVEVDGKIVVRFDKPLDCSEPFSFSVILTVEDELNDFVNNDLLLVCQESSIGVMLDSSHYNTSQFIGKHLSMVIANVSDIHGNVMDRSIVYEADVIPVSSERRRLAEMHSKAGNLFYDHEKVAAPLEAVVNIEAMEILRSRLFKIRGFQSNVEAYLQYVLIGLAMVLFLQSIHCFIKKRISVKNMNLERNCSSYHSNSDKSSEFAHVQHANNNWIGV